MILSMNDIGGAGRLIFQSDDRILRQVSSGRQVAIGQLSIIRATGSGPMRRGRPPLDLVCPACGSALVPAAEEAGGDIHRLRCGQCGETFWARPRPTPVRDPSPPPPVGGFDLGVRAGLLRLVPWVYDAGLTVGAAGLFVAGGFFAIGRRWLDDSGGDRAGWIEAMGGIRIARTSNDPDSDLGPVLRRSDAPNLFEEVAEVARRLGVRPPEEVRLAFLPCCGVVAWRRSRALLLGLPLLHALTLAELRAVLAHELAHLARGDATWAAGSLRFVEGLGRELDEPSGRSWGPLRLWANLCRAAASALIGPIARGQEARADRASAGIAGGGPAASALVKVAMVQPLFRELLGQVEPDRPPGSNLYATFRAFWDRLPAPLLESIRLGLLVRAAEPRDSPHPPLADRVAAVLIYPNRTDAPSDEVAASTLLGDPEWLERMLHDRLYRLPAIEPSVFHRSGT